MTPTRYLIIMFEALCVFLWCGTAFAAGALLTDGPRLNPLLTDPLVLALGAMIATAAGVTTLAMRINTLLATQDPANPRPMVKPWLFAVAHVGGSYLAAIAGLLLASMGKLEVDAALLLILLMAFGGAKALEAVAEKYLPITRLVTPTTP